MIWHILLTWKNGLREICQNTLPYFPNVIRSATFFSQNYFVGKFRIRIDRIIDFRENDKKHMSYFSKMELRFEVNLLEVLCPDKSPI